MLIEKLQEQLSEFDKKAKLNVRLIQRKERLAYVTVNLSNIIQVTSLSFINTERSYQYLFFTAGVEKVWPVGQIRLASSVDSARGCSSVLTLNPACVLPPNALKDKRLFLC